MEEVKFCKDCRHYMHPEYPPAECGSPKNQADLVHGGVIWSAPRLSRDMDERCGKSGAWFERWTQEEIEGKANKKRLSEIQAATVWAEARSESHPAETAKDLAKQVMEEISRWRMWFSR